MKTALILAGLLMTQPPAQDFGSLDGPAKKPAQYVVFVAEPQSVAAGKRVMLELRFKVQDGYHIVSHVPKSELQIPTVISLPSGDGVTVAAAEYPAGKIYSFSFDPSEKLDVYQGNFTVRVPVVAGAGAHELKGKLTYQACDTAACYPPRTLPVDVLFTAK